MPAARDRDTFDLSRFLPYLLDRLAGRMSEDLSALYAARAELATPDWRVLVWLHHAGPLSAQDIALRAHMDKATVSRAVGRLETRGLLSRELDPGDQRSRTLSLTRKGRGLLTRLLPQVQAWETSLLEPLSANERSQLSQLLGKLEGRLTALREAEDAPD